MNLSPLLKQRFFDSNGQPLAGGKLYSYQAGTTTPQATFANYAGSANTNPVILDSNGYADVWLDPTLSYKFVLKDTDNNTIWTVDNISFESGITPWSANSVYKQGSIVSDASGYGVLYVSMIDNNQGQPLTNVSAWRFIDGNIRTVSGSMNLTIADNLVRSNSTSGSLIQTLPPCASTPIGKQITIKDIGTGGNRTSIKGYGSDQVDGNNTYSTTLRQNESVTVMNAGTQWETMGGIVIHNASVTLEKAAPELLPAGMVVPFAGAAAPTGWLLCDGTSYLRTAYPTLFAALGGASSPWGLPDDTHFKVPDARGRFIRGVGTNSDGNGGDSVALGAYQSDMLKDHFHGIFVSSDNFGGPMVASANGTGSISSASTQGSGSVETRPKSYGMNYIIKY